MKTMKNKKSLVKFVVTTVVWLLLLSGAFTWLGYTIGFNIGSDKAPMIGYEYLGDDLVRFVDDEIEGILSLEEEQYTAFIVWDWEWYEELTNDDMDNVLGFTGINIYNDVLICVRGINKWVIWHEYIHAWDILVHGSTVYNDNNFEEIVDLTEAQTNYLAYLLLLKYGYTKDAEILFNDMTSRSDAYGYPQLLEDGEEEIELIALSL